MNTVALIINVGFALVAAVASQAIELDARIGPADPKLYRSIRDAADWQNPYLIIYPDGIELRVLGHPASEPRRFDASRLQQALSALPLASWPYGRVVAIQNVGILGADSDVEQIAKLRQAAIAVLERLGITVDYWPA